MNKLAHLPIELISSILEYVNEKDLATCTRINKQLYQIAMPLLYRQLVIDHIGWEGMFTMLTISTNTPTSPTRHIRSIRIKINLSDTTLLSLLPHVPHLEHLHMLRGSAISDASFQHIPQYCPYLISVHAQNARITQASIVALGQHCHQLASVLFRYCFALEIHHFSALRRCPLKELTIIRCNMDVFRDRVAAQKTVRSLAEWFPQLTSLSIIEYAYDMTPVITTGVWWPHLHRLSLTACRTLEDAMVVPFLQAHPHLDYLELKGSKMTDHTLDAIATWVPHIKEVCVDDNPQITMAGLCRLVKRCVRLERGVHFEDCGIFVDDVDFPQDLAPDLYQTTTDIADYISMDERINYQVIWLAGHAFDRADTKPKSK